MSRSYPTNSLLDFMAAYAAPLFYAQQHRETTLALFLEKLKRQPEHTSKVAAFNAFCHQLFDLLNKPEKSKEICTRVLTTTKDQLAAQYHALFQEHKAVKAAIEALESHPIADEDLLESYEDRIEELNKILANLLQKFLEIEQTIASIQMASTHANQAGLFFEEVELFATSFRDGKNGLSCYFEDNPITAFFFNSATVQSTFKEIATLFYKEVIDKGYSLRNHPLPMYLCPFDGRDEAFTYTIEHEGFYHYHKILEEAKAQSMPQLVDVLTSIQHQIKLKELSPPRYRATRTIRLCPPAPLRPIEEPTVPSVCSTTTSTADTIPTA